jgi:hypothetical protein
VFAHCASVALVGLPLREELIDALGVIALGCVVSLDCVLGIKVGVLADVLDVYGGFRGD